MNGISYRYRMCFQNVECRMQNAEYSQRSETKAIRRAKEGTFTAARRTERGASRKLLRQYPAGSTCLAAR